MHTQTYIHEFALKKRRNGRITKCNGCSNGYTKDEKWVLLSKKKIPKRGTTTKDGELVEMQIHFHFKKECLRNTKFKISELLIPELYSYNKVDGEKEWGEISIKSYIRI